MPRAGSGAAAPATRLPGSPRSSSRRRRLGERGVDLGQRLEQRGREARGRLGRGDLVHLADVAARLRRRAREAPLDVRDQLGRGGLQIGDDVLEDAVRMRRDAAPARGAPWCPCRPMRCSSSPPRPRRLRHRRRSGRHLRTEGRRPPGRAAPRDRRASCRASRAAAPRSSRPPFRRLPRTPRTGSRERLRARSRSARRGAAARTALARPAGRLRRRRSRARAARSRERRPLRERRRPGRQKQRERGAFREPSRALASSLERRDDASAASGERVRHRAPHRTEADDADGGHASAARHVGRDREPASVATRPDIGVPPAPGAPSGPAYVVRPWTIATSPSRRTSTSCASSPEIVTGFAVCSRNASRSTSDPSGFEQRKSSARSSSKRRTSPFWTELT